MHLLALACESLSRPVHYFASHSPHRVEIEVLPRGLHQPAEIRTRLQQRLEAHAQAPLDAILLVYGLCGQAAAGLRARAHPLVIPRAHDCITLYLGSRQAYNREVQQEPGTYWYSQDYLEASAGVNPALTLGVPTGGDPQALYLKYVEKYGQAKADRLMQVMNGWWAHYQRAVYLDTGLEDDSRAQAAAQQAAVSRGWAFESLPADLGLVQRLLNGDWEEDFLVVPPGQEIAMSYDDEILCARLPSPDKPPG
jgi:hypothetical protein